MKKLFLFARGFPYNISEPYLETEIKYYEEFDEVHIFSLSVYKNDEKRNVYGSEKYYFHKIPFLPKFNYIWEFIKILVRPEFYNELFKMGKNKVMNIKNLFKLFIFMARESIEREIVSNIIIGENLITKKDEIVFYCYRFDYGALLISNLSNFNAKNIIRVIRAHRMDLYEEENLNYLPFREYILERINRVYLISQDGNEYLERRYPVFKSKMFLSYLGTNPINRPQFFSSNILRIVSCSNIVPVKRLDLLYNALQLLDFEVEWTHYGDGVEYDKMLYIVKKSKKNIKINFKGHVNNVELLKEYENKIFDVFINVSSSEGLPVSIMEACSVGLPIIATDVGGTSEIIKNNKNGYLLDENCNEKDIATVIKNFWMLSEQEKIKLRNASFDIWQNKFNSKKNYINFVDELLKSLDRNEK